MFLMKDVTEFPIVFQNFWKKMGWKPSRLGAFRGLKEKITSLISKSVTFWARRL